MARTTSTMAEARLMLEVYTRIPTSRKISTTELMNSLEYDGIKIPRRSLQRYLLALDIADMGVNVDKSSKPYGYRREITRKDLEHIGLSPSGALLLLLAREHLRYLLPSNITKSLGHLFEAADQYLSMEAGRSKHVQWLEKVAFVGNSLPMLSPKILQGVLDTVSEGLFKQVNLRIKYIKSNGEAIEEEVSPLGLVQQDVRLYLVCSYGDPLKIRNFALHRIKAAELIERPSVVPKDFRLKEYVAKKLFNYGSGRKVILQMVFTSPETALNREETPFNSTQKIEKLEDGKYRLTVQIEDSILLHGWIESWREKAGIESVKMTEI